MPENEEDKSGWTFGKTYRVKVHGRTVNLIPDVVEDPVSEARHYIWQARVYDVAKVHYGFGEDPKSALIAALNHQEMTKMGRRNTLDDMERQAP